MKKVVVDHFELTEKYVDRLLHELKKEGVITRADLQDYLKDYWYTKDVTLQSHLLMSKNPNKKNFALPFDD